MNMNDKTQGPIKQGVLLSGIVGTDPVLQAQTEAGRGKKKEKRGKRRKKEKKKREKEKRLKEIHGQGCTMHSHKEKIQSIKVKIDFK